MTDLSILIPARNEMFLRRTIEDILQHAEGDTEVIVGLDGAWADPQLEDNPRVIILHYSESIGQRALTNQLCRLSTAKYVMKVDAHCAFDQGFDVKMMAKMEDDITMAPVMRNLHAFNWKCPDGHTRYQSPSGPCLEKVTIDGEEVCCDKPTERDVVWIPKTNPQSWAYVFDTEPHFQYANEHKKRVGRVGLTETMSLQGSCFMMTREKYWELNICDEKFGSWGSQGIEVAAKTWLSGGRVLVNHDTWYAHMFRTQGGDFSFPYPQSGSQVAGAKKIAKEMFFQGTWESVHPLSWLVEKFWPVPGWTEEDLQRLKDKPPSKGILYYSDNQIPWKFARKCRQPLIDSGLPITSVTLKGINLGRNIVVPEIRGVLTMFKQILIGLEAMTEDIVYFAEHDVLYPKEHFAFTPTEDKFYYNGNYWFVRQDGFALHYNVSPLSGLVAYRKSLITHFRERVALIEDIGYSTKIGFEPMTHKRIKWKNWYDFEVFMPAVPNVDFTTGQNTTWKRWSKDKFRTKPLFWEESTVENIPGWGNLRPWLEA